MDNFLSEKSPLAPLCQRGGTDCRFNLFFSVNFKLIMKVQLILQGQTSGLPIIELNLLRLLQKSITPSPLPSPTRGEG